MPSQRRTKKATFALDEAVLSDAKEIAGRTEYRSLNAFVEAAISEMTKRYRREEIKRQLSAASRDPLFLEDVTKVERDFQDADWESLRNNS